MSSLIVEICYVDDVQVHPNADRLEVAYVKGWQTVIQKGSFKPGDKCVYIPIDSILPADVEVKIFPPESKIKLSKSRVKTIKLRGAISAGLIIEPELFGLQELPVGSDVATILGITKYEPPAAPRQMQAGVGTRKQSNPHFTRYTDIENFKHYPKLFEEGEEVVAHEKIHGTNFRAGWVEAVQDTWWKKLLSFLGLRGKYEFVYGSHNVQLQNKFFYNGYYKSNVYAAAVKKYDLPNKLKAGEVVYGEIYGDGVQKGYTYGCDLNERKLVIFDLKKDGKYQDYDTLRNFCAERDLPMPPLLYAGPFLAPTLKLYVSGDSVLAPSQKIREGIVVKSAKETFSIVGRKILKLINDDYLLADQTDYH